MSHMILFKQKMPEKSQKVPTNKKNGYKEPKSAENVRKAGFYSIGAGQKYFLVENQEIRIFAIFSIFEV